MDCVGRPGRSLVNRRRQNAPDARVRALNPTGALGWLPAYAPGVRLYSYLYSYIVRTSWSRSRQEQIRYVPCSGRPMTARPRPKACCQSMCSIDRGRRVYAPAYPTFTGSRNVGKRLRRFEVTDSLPIPRRTGVFAARENMTSGALSVSERPFHSTNPNAAGVPTS